MPSRARTDTRQLDLFYAFVGDVPLRDERESMMKALRACLTLSSACLSPPNLAMSGGKLALVRFVPLSWSTCRPTASTNSN